MIDEGKLNEAAVRGARAEELLQNELLKESFLVLREKYTESWTRSEPHERELREYLWKSLQVLTDVENHITKIANNGRMAKHELELMAARQKPSRA